MSHSLEKRELVCVFIHTCHFSCDVYSLQPVIWDMCMKVTREINNIQIYFFFANAIMRGLTMWFFDKRWAMKRNDNFMQKTKTIAINAIVNMNLLVLLLFLQFTSSTDSFRIKWINQCYRKCILFWVQSYLIGGKAASTAATEKKLCELCKNINVHNFFLFLFIDI